MVFGRWRWRVGAALLAWLAGGPAMAAAPKVVVTIKPVHALVASVMAGVGEPVLLITGAGSPHTYSLRPADAQAIGAAAVVVWVGPALEAFLQKPLRVLGAGARLITLMQDAGLDLLPVRAGGADHGHAEAMDAHVWLDPANAILIVRHVAAVLGAVDGANAARYQANTEPAVAAITALDQAIAARLAGVRDRPYVVFHDAYQYFERRYGLAAAGAITVSPERPPGAKRLHEIRSRIIALKAGCVFAEPQFAPPLVATVIGGTGARAGVLDPLGSAEPAGPGAYLGLLRTLAHNLGDCLGAHR
ncbi:MAG: zinc ABC transporter substrate-binding protein [Alphaproteobacteria bacterium]|nr:zinc ABC transporter substrate-binding protein [Alphaproteobacteria bacterium]